MQLALSLLFLLSLSVCAQATVHNIQLSKDVTYAVLGNDYTFTGCALGRSDNNPMEVNAYRVAGGHFQVKKWTNIVGAADISSVTGTVDSATLTLQV